MAVDVGPIVRQRSTRVGDFFGDRVELTLNNELVRGQVRERAVGPTLIAVRPPGFDDGLHVGNRHELMYVQPPRMTKSEANNHDLFAVFNVCHKFIDAVRDIGPNRP